ncbi:MAG: alanine dehydrogenase [Bacteroidales bacterium]|nr:alanine dehydrogenase [Bacteroidales bacterium]
MDTTRKPFLDMEHTEQMSPQEKLVKTHKENYRRSIGIPRELSPDENRVPLVPSSVSVLVANGHQVIVQAGAGLRANFADIEYVESGAIIVQSAEEAFRAEIVLKVAPLFDSEIEYLKPRQVLISSIQAVTHCKDYFKKLLARKITALAFEAIKDESGAYPVLKAMSEIVGTTSVLIAAEYLADPLLGRGSMLGGFPGVNPSEIVIIGAGTVGEYAARTALGMGAMVKVFDDNIYKLRNIQHHLGVRLFTSIIQPEVLNKSLRTADVAIGAVHSKECITPLYVSEENVRMMKKGAVIIDISIDQGGVFATSKPTTHSNPVYSLHDVTHYCVPNIASKVPHTASYALSNLFAPILNRMNEASTFEVFLKRNSSFRQGVYMLNGTLTSKFIGDYYQIPYKDIELLMAAF